MNFTQNTTKMRQAGTWDPLLQGLHWDTPLLQQWNTKKLQGAKTNYVHVQFVQTMDKRYKQTKKGQLPLLKSWEQKQYIVRAPCIQCYLSPPSSPTPDRFLLLPCIKEPTHSHPLSKQQGNLLLILIPSFRPHPHLNFLTGLWSISIDLGRPRTLVSIKKTGDNAEPLITKK